MGILGSADFLQDDTAKPGTLEFFFEEEPVSLDTFIADSKFLKNPPLSPVQSAAVRHIERIYFPEMYPLMAEGFGGYWKEVEDVRMTNLITLQWGKGCISADESVFSATDGRWRKVSEIQEPFKVAGTNEVNPDGDTAHVSGQSVFSRGTVGQTFSASAPFKRGTGEMVRVTTNSGGQIDVYMGHLFASWRTNELPYKNRYVKAEPVWKSAAELSVGDRLAVLSKLDVETPVPQDPKEIELVGYWIGDGSMPIRGSAQWALYMGATGTEDLLERYTGLVESYEGITAKVETMRSGALRIRATRSGIGHKGRGPLIDIIHKYGLYGSRAWNKKIPEEFYSLPEDQIALFLSALWDTDGTVYLKKNRDALSPHLSYTSVSEELARGVQRLLLRLGVVARLTSKTPSYEYKGEKKQGRTAWTVSVDSGVFAKRLASLLSLHGPKEELRKIAADRPLGKVQQATDGDIYWDTVKSIEPLGVGDYWDMNVPEGGSYVAGSIAVLSSNSGKDHICRIAALRVAYLLLCLKNPVTYYGLPEQDSIHMLNIASSSTQAETAFFRPLVRAVERRGSWFYDKAEGKQGFIKYAKNIEAISGHSDAESQEGGNLILGVLDEIDAFRAKEELERYRSGALRESPRSAESLIDMIKSSSTTRFPQVFKNVRISYPRYQGSTIQKLTEEGKRDNEKYGIKSNHYVSGPLPTWEVNPLRTKEDFASDFEKDPALAEAKYACNPTRSSDAYFRNMPAIKQAVDRSTQPVSVRYELSDMPNAQGEGKVKVWNVVYSYADDFQPIQGARYAIHADLAIVGDRAGISMSHIEKYIDRTEYVELPDGNMQESVVRVPVIRNDFTIALEASLASTPAREIQIRWARQLAFELVKRGFYICLFSFDGFQSADSMQILNSHGIESTRISADINDNPYKTLRDVAYDGRLHMPFNQLLFDELEKLTRHGKKIDHPPGGSKDLADALACSIVGAISSLGEEDADGLIVDIGSPMFSVGPALAPLEGMNSPSLGSLMPIGMKGAGLYG